MGCGHVVKDSRLDLVSKRYHGNYTAEASGLHRPGSLMLP